MVVIISWNYVLGKLVAMDGNLALSFFGATASVVGFMVLPRNYK